MSKITESAKGEECQVRIPGVCNHNPETVVFAHINGGGMGKKQPDTEGAYCCSACHDELDGRTHNNYETKDGLALLHHEGAMRTRKILLDKGLIKI
jgi:hypothetical protein